LPTASDSSFPRCRPTLHLLMLRALVWSTLTIAGFFQAWASRFSLSPDATNYLDIASAYLRQDWHNAINAYWSPLFSWLLALVLFLFRPSLYSESTALHLLNFAGLLISLCCFEYFFRALLQFRKTYSTASPDTAVPSDLPLWCLVYSVFLSTSLFVLAFPSTTTPDVWVSSFTFLAAALTLRIASNAGGVRAFVFLGVVLGFAYLTKSFYFPMAFVFIFAAGLARRPFRKAFQHAAVSLLVFALIAGPWIVLLSRAKGRPTFGDVGRLAFVMTVDRLQQPLYWQGENHTGTPLHPVRQLLRSPRLFEFATPIDGAYPPSHDLSYWMDGARPHFNLSGQLSVLRQSFGSFFQVFLSQAEFAVGFLTLLFLVPTPRPWRAPYKKLVVLWLPPILACAGYALVLVEGRYVAPFLLLLWIAAFFLVLDLSSAISPRVLRAVVLAVASVTALRIAKLVQTNLTAALAYPQNIDAQVAQSLRALGIPTGARVAALCDIGELHWARVAQVKIVSQIPLGEEGVFWTADEQTQRAIFETFAATGATTVITLHPPPFAANLGWLPLGATYFYAHLLPPATPPSVFVYPGAPPLVSKGGSFSALEALRP
jgi:4-amino-4-deoxy-L-arabinose transferase-like glycosyltransferase